MQSITWTRYLHNSSVDMAALTHGFLKRNFLTKCTVKKLNKLKCEWVDNCVWNMYSSRRDMELR